MRAFHVFCSIALLFVTLSLPEECGAAASKKLKVLTTFTVIADMARNVAGDAAEVASIVKAGAEIHNYQPTPRDLVRAQNADLILWNGLHLEMWAEKFFCNLSDIPRVIVSEGVDAIGIDEGPYRGMPNPHAWMSPSNGIIYVENIRRALVESDPSNRSIYDRNAAAYAAQIQQMIAPLRQALVAIPSDKRWLVTSEGAFSYLAADFDLKELFLWPINADQQGTPQQVRKVIDGVRTHNIPVVFSESTVSDAAARQVARETGARYGGVLYVESLSGPHGPVPTYLDMLRKSVEAIVTGLAI